jgi:hypothetical protein
MKKLFALLFCVYGVSSIAQTTTEKYNSLMSRYEYYNSSGTMIGYKTYDSLMQTWNYYEVKQPTQTQSTYQYVEPVNLKLVNQALASKQARYDNNTKSVQDAINILRNNVNNSAYSQTVKNNCISAFNEKCVAVLNANTYDYTNSKTTEIINWLSDSMSSFINYYAQQEKQTALIEEQKRKELTSQIKNEMNYNVGGFTTNDVTEEKYNPYTKTYEIVTKDTSLTKVYFDIGYLHYFRQAYNGWRLYQWKYTHAADNYHIITDINTGTQIEIGKLFDWIIFSEQKVGDVYTKRYIYRNLKKDKTVMPKY